MGWFGNRLFLLGLLFALVPLILHLIWRTRAPRVFFPTVRFIKDAVKMTRRRKRIQNLLLLIMRMLMFALVPLGLADPRIPIGNKPRADTATVIIVDNSYSMATREGEKLRYEKALETLHEFVSSLSKGDECAILFTCRTGSSEASEDENGAAGRSLIETGLVKSPETLTAMLDSFRLGSGTARIGDQLKKAYEILRDTKLENKEIIIAGDLQKISWQLKNFQERPEEFYKIPVLIVDCGSGDYRNLAVTDVKVEGPLGSPQGRTVTAEVFNASPGRVTDQKVSLFAGSRKVDEKTVTLDPGETRKVEFSLAGIGSNEVQGRVVLPRDSLEEDNVRYFVLGTRRNISVAVVRDREAEFEFLDPAFYIIRALNPGLVLGKRGISNINPVTATVEDLTIDRLRPFDVVFLLDSSEITYSGASALEQFVREGGAMVVMPGEHFSSKLYDERFGSKRYKGRALLPAVNPDPVESGGALPVENVNYAHPALQIFVSDQAGFFRPLNIYKYFHIEADEESDVVLASIRGGGPFLLERTYGKGRTFFFALGPDREWSNFVLAPVFPVLMVQLVNYAAAKSSVPEHYLTGMPVAFPLGRYKDADIMVTPPGASRPKSVRRPKGTIRVNEVFFRNTFTPGIYSYAPSTGVGPAGVFAVNRYGAESNLERVDAEAVKKALEGATVFYADNGEDARKMSDLIREGIHSRLITYFLVAALLVTLAEGFYSNFVKPSRAKQQATRQTGGREG